MARTWVLALWALAAAAALPAAAWARPSALSLLHAALEPEALRAVTQWECVEVAAAWLGAAARWQRLNCSSPGVPVFGRAGPVLVNVVTANLSDTLRLVPLIALSNASEGAAAAAGAGALAPLDAIAAQHARAGRTLLAGVNGGYFWRLDSAKFVDGVCLGKTRAEAAAAASPGAPNLGVGDAATISERGEWLSSNCDCVGFSRPAVLSVNGSDARVDVLSRGAAPPFGTRLPALSAGPNLLLTNASGTFIGIPHDDDNVLNILEHSANTAVGLRPRGAGAATAWLVTFDGSDRCAWYDPRCGTNAFTLAYFLKDHLGATAALGMDQGGSTTMFARGQSGPRPDHPGVVSDSGGEPRAVFNGLFLEER